MSVGTKGRFSVFPVGVVKKSAEGTLIEVMGSYEEALMGLEGFSHIVVL
jgi:tRNA (Thr-GGU) A37 N-methylase